VAPSMDDRETPGGFRKGVDLSSPEAMVDNGRGMYQNRRIDPPAVWNGAGNHSGGFMSEQRNGDVLTAFVLGGIIGAALGILFAPAKGKETREKINDWLEDTKEKAKEKLDTLEEEIKKRKEQLLKHN